MSKTYSAGIVTAYGAAKRAGYQGTYEDFCRQQAGYAGNAAAVEQAKTDAVNAKNDAVTAKNTAVSAKDDAVSAKDTAVAKASEASTSATNASQSATNAETSATSAHGYALDAEQSAQSVSASVQQIATNTADISQLKADLDDKTDELKSAIREGYYKPELVSGEYVDYSTGEIKTENSWSRTSFIPCDGMESIHVHVSSIPRPMIYNAFYSGTSDDLYVSSFAVPNLGEGSVKVPNNAKYFILSCESSEMRRVSIKLTNYANVVNRVDNLDNVASLLSKNIFLSNYYIDISTRKFTSYNGWTIYKCFLTKGTRVRISGLSSASVIARCSDAIPTSDSLFDILFVLDFVSNEYVYTIPEDGDVYISIKTTDFNKFSEINIESFDIGSIQDRVETLEDQVETLEDQVETLVEQNVSLSPELYFDNSYIIDNGSHGIGTYSEWGVYRFSVNAKDTLTVTLVGSGALLATCIDSEPTTESKFNIIVTKTNYSEEVTYTAQDDMVIYMSMVKSYVSNIEIVRSNPISVWALDNRITAINNRVDAIVSSESNQGSGFSLDYNNALEVIEEFEYSGQDVNPWIALEHLDDFEQYGAYLDNKIASIPSGDSFIWITDVHYTSNNKRSGALVDYVRRKAGIKTILHGGDVQNERPYAIDAAKDWFDFNKDYVGRIGSDFKQVCGDHDHNGQYWGKTELREQYELTDPAKTFFTCKFVQKVLTGYCENEIVWDDTYDDAIAEYEWTEDDIAEYNAFKKMHYYFDDHKIKTRFIVLFTGWSWSDYGFPYSKSGSASILSVQTEFLYDALMTTPNNYNVIVCGHDTVINTPVVENSTTYYDTTSVEYNSKGWKFIAKMLYGLKTKGTATAIKVSDWSQPYTNDTTPTKTFDFSFAPDVNAVFTMGGDVHWDILSKTTGASDSVSVVASGGYIDKDSEIVHAVTMTDGHDRGYLDYNTRERICPPDTEGTVNEQAFDVVTINDSGIYFTRIGCGDDRYILWDNQQ